MLLQILKAGSDILGYIVKKPALFLNGCIYERFPELLAGGEKRGVKFFRGHADRASAHDDQLFQIVVRSYGDAAAFFEPAHRPFDIGVGGLVFLGEDDMDV